MSSTEIRGNVEVSNVNRLASESHSKELRCGKDGSLFTADWFQSMAMEGRMFCAQAGVLTTPITWTATAANDQAKPAMFISVPDGTTIIPLEISLYMEAFGTDSLFECAAITGTGGVSAGGTAMSITNMRTDAPHTSLCTATSDLTGGTACTANVNEFWKSGVQKVATTATADDASMRNPDVFTWRYTDGMFAPVIKGAGQIMVTQGSQAGTGFGRIIFVEIPTAWLL